MVRIAAIALLLVCSSLAAYAQSATVVSENAKLRGTPTPSGKVVDKLSQGTVVYILQQRGEWSLVQSTDYAGWMRADTLLIEKSSPTLSTEPGRGSGNGDGLGLGSGRGNGDGLGDGDLNNPKPIDGSTVGLKILRKPKPAYTNEARDSNIRGNVILRVTFLATGVIGAITVVKGLPNGLNEQAIEAARGIRFEPAKKNGVPYTVSKEITYSFTTY